MLPLFITIRAEGKGGEGGGGVWVGADAARSGHLNYTVSRMTHVYKEASKNSCFHLGLLVACLLNIPAIC